MVVLTGIAFFQARTIIEITLELDLHLAIVNANTTRVRFNYYSTYH